MASPALEPDISRVDVDLRPDRDLLLRLRDKFCRTVKVNGWAWPLSAPGTAFAVMSSSGRTVKGDAEENVSASAALRSMCLLFLCCLFIVSPFMVSPSNLLLFIL